MTNAGARTSMNGRSLNEMVLSKNSISTKCMFCDEKKDLLNHSEGQLHMCLKKANKFFELWVNAVE